MASELRGAQRLIDVFVDLNRSMSVLAVRTFLTVADEEGMKGVDYAQSLGLPQTTASRILLDLSEYRRDLTSEAGGDQDVPARKAGYGLVESRVDVMELRAKRYFLTPRGRAVKRKIAGILADA
jgi:DNA-binding MarR family transcriptional regulator